MGRTIRGGIRGWRRGIEQAHWLALVSDLVLRRETRFADLMISPRGNSLACSFWLRKSQHSWGTINANVRGCGALHHAGRLCNSTCPDCRGCKVPVDWDVQG